MWRQLKTELYFNWMICILILYFLFPISVLIKIKKEENETACSTHILCVCAGVWLCVCMCVCVRRNTYSATQMYIERVTQWLFLYILFMNILQFCVEANFLTIIAFGNFHHNPFIFPRWCIISSILCPSKIIHFILCIFLPLTVLYTFSHLFSTPNS